MLLWEDYDTDPHPPTERPAVNPRLLTHGIPIGLLLSAPLWGALFALGWALAGMRFP